MKFWWWLWMGLGWWAMGHSAYAQQTCAPRVLAVQAAPEIQKPTGPHGVARPVNGWEDVHLPDTWSQRWPDHHDAVWYRMDWERGCADGVSPADPVALGVDGISMAGAVYSNDSLLWRDALLEEPFSRSWNVPRWWVLPEATLHDGVNQVWVRVVGVPELAPGLGRMRIGPSEVVQAVQERYWWRQRTVYMLTAGMAIAIGGLFLVVWLLRRSEQAFGWYALVSLSWAGYLGTLLATSSWPWQNALALSRLNLALFVVYALSLCCFIWRFSGQHMPRIERALYGLAGVAIVAVCAVPVAFVPAVFRCVWAGSVLLVMANCVQFQWYAWRPRPEGRKLSSMLLALCCLLMLVVGGHDAFLVLQMWSIETSWSPVVGPVSTMLLAVLVGWRLAVGMRRIEQFNHELEVRVDVARQELALAQEREHAHALDKAKMQERMEIAHDLHDGLGGSLVRSMALVEQAQEALPKERVLSFLKIMRDDLRQVIDHGSSVGVTIPATPVQWAAPLRHRFTRILDELDVASEWRIAPQWHSQYRPSALQCLNLTRLVEEALANVIKHSQARHLRVTIRVDGGDTQPSVMVLHIEDDGIGFDVAAVQSAGLSVGMRSMAARAQRVGALFKVQSGPSGTIVSAVLHMPKTA